mmetsp:Transcript_14368/g.36649  ORF Transcript_14368/g.36649 Transcript_14368/m.36649 type:complete len:84 (-) Transcript_14368:36-287(-)
MMVLVNDVKFTIAGIFMCLTAHCLHQTRLAAWQMPSCPFIHRILVTGYLPSPGVSSLSVQQIRCYRRFFLFSPLVASTVRAVD